MHLLPLPLLVIVSLLPFSILAQHRPQQLHSTDFSEYYFNAENQKSIKGIILNLPDDIVRDKLVSFYAVPLLSKFRRQVTVVVEADGSFTIDLPENYPAQEVFFGVEDKETSLYSGTLIVQDSLFVSIDYAELKRQSDFKPGLIPGVTFSGPDAELTRARNVLTAVEVAMGYYDDYVPILTDEATSGAEKRALIDSLYSQIAGYQAEALQDFPNDIQDFFFRNLLSTQLGILAITFWQEELSPGFIKRYYAHTPPVISNAGKEYYKYFADAFTSAARRAAKTSEDDNFPPLADQLAALNSILSDFSPEQADLVYLFQEDTDPEADLQRLDNALAHVQTPWIAHQLQKRRDLTKAEIEKLQATLDRIVPNETPASIGDTIGTLSFGADLYTIAGDISGEELLAKLRNAFPGKALYLDFWAVWCQPCLGEMPYSTRIKKATKDLPITFIYLCTDRGGSLKQWQNTISRYEVGGTHFYVPEKAHQELMQLFSGRGYPTYVLIQADGTPKLDIQRPSQLNRKKLLKVLK